MTAQQLKNSILQIAVQGKLVPQDPSDEPASVLLERIRAEKQELIKAGKIKKDKKSSEIFRGASRNLPYAYCEQIGKEIRDISDEIPFDIPDSWEWVHLDHIAISDLGKTLDKAKNTGNFQPYLCSINVYWNGIDLSKVKEARFEDSELPKYLLKKGDLLICEGGEVGRCCVWDKDISMYYQNALHRVRFYGNINPYYFKCLMELYKGIGIIDAHSKGVTIKHLVQKSLNSIYFPLPPLAEQHRIVAKIEELLPYIERYGKAETHLTALNTTFPEALKKSILQEAVQGKLVPQNPDDEPASVLLECIRAEKQALIKVGKIKKEKPLPPITEEEIPFEIPESWCWCKMEMISSKITDGEHKTPRRTQVFSGYYLLSARNIHNGQMNLDNVDYVDKEEYNKISVRCNPKKDDILISCSGSVGRCCIVADDNKYVMVRSAAMISPILVFSKWIMYCIQSEMIQEQVRSKTKTTAQSNLFQEAIRSLMLPLPPLTEQKRIVAKIEEIMPYISAI